jgi:Ca2+-binding EF-hand superfamily protein
MNHYKCLQLPIALCLAILLSGCTGSSQSTASKGSNNDPSKDNVANDPKSGQATEPQTDPDKDSKAVDAKEVDSTNTPDTESTKIEGSDSKSGDTASNGDSKQGMKSDASEKTDKISSEKIPTGSWTTQRLIAATVKGPVVIDLMLQVGENDLATASEAAIEPIAKTLIESSTEKVEWKTILDQPLLKSGWLGNLVADAAQVDQLVAMYDKDKNGLVEPEELTLYLTRGLSRTAPLSLADIGNEPANNDSESPFGPMDVDKDNALSKDELEGAGGVLSKFDFNGDSIVSLTELGSTDEVQMVANRRMGRMLKSSSLIFEPPSSSLEDNATRKKGFQRKIVELMEFYSFLGEIERDQWPSMSDSQWASLDANGDERLSKTELLAIFSCPPMVKVAMRLPTPDEKSGKPAWFVESADGSFAWKASESTSEVSSGTCCVKFDFEESFTDFARTVLRTQLNESLNNPQLQQFLMQQLQLREGAFEIADANRDSKLDDDEFAKVWKWLTARQSARLQSRWMVSASPWFQLLDRDLNQSIGEVEMSQIATQFSQFDGDTDGEVASGELPTVYRLRISRNEQRLNLPIPTSPTSQPAVQDSDWFSAMDTNRDGSIGRAEFLGASSDFRAADKNGDGFISKSEVY